MFRLRRGVTIKEFEDEFHTISEFEDGPVAHTVKEFEVTGEETEAELDEMLQTIGGEFPKKLHYSN